MQYSHKQKPLKTKPMRTVEQIDFSNCAAVAESLARLMFNKPDVKVCTSIKEGAYQLAEVAIPGFDQYSKLRTLEKKYGVKVINGWNTPVLHQEKDQVDYDWNKCILHIAVIDTVPQLMSIGYIDGRQQKFLNIEPDSEDFAIFVSLEFCDQQRQTTISNSEFSVYYSRALLPAAYAKLN